MPAPDSVMAIPALEPGMMLWVGVNEIVAVVEEAFTTDVNVMARPFNQEMPGNVPVLVESITFPDAASKLFEKAAATFVSPA